MKLSLNIIAIDFKIAPDHPPYFVFVSGALVVGRPLDDASVAPAADDVAILHDADRENTAVVRRGAGNDDLVRT